MNSMQWTAHDLVAAQLYTNESDANQEAISHLLRNRPELRIALAVHSYRTNPMLTLAQAAAMAGVSLERIKEILLIQGVPLRLGPATIAEAAAEISTMESWLDERAG